MGLLKILFILTLITFPLGQIARLQFSGDINITLFDATALATSIVWLIYTLNKQKKTAATLAKPILFFAGAIIISLVANLFRYSGIELFVAALYGIRWVLFACLYFVIFDFDEAFVKKIPFFLTITGGVVVLLGYLQYFFYQDLRNLYYLGWDDHVYRMFSSFLDPNFAAAFFVLFFLFLLARLREKAFTYTTKDQIPLALLAIADFIAIFLTTSRSGFIMLAVGLLAYLILIGKKKWMFGFIGIVAIVLLITSRFFYIENINPFRTASSTARIESAGNALKIIENNPLFGIGFNAYRYALSEAGIPVGQTQFPGHSGSGTDNSFLFVFATTGMLGFVAFLYLMTEIMRLGLKKAKKTSGKLLIAVVVGIVVNSLFINSLFYPMLLFWLWVIIGLTDYT